MNTTDKEDVYFRGWYAKNGDTLNKSRRDRYTTDPEYREAVLKRNREARQKKREASNKERAQERKATRMRVGSRGWKTTEVAVEQDGKTATATLFTIGALARSLGRSVQAVRLWEREGLLPETELRNKKGDRLYTGDMIATIRDVMKAQGKTSKTATRPRPMPKGVVREVQYEDGTKELLHFFRVGVLAEAIQRTVVTVEILEGKGYVPTTPFIASGTKYRVYTLPMIEAVRKAFESRGGDIRGEADWKSFEKDVRAAWQSLKVFGAKLCDAPKK